MKGFSMRILFTLAIVVGTMATCSTTVDAQIYNDGYQFGAGFRNSYGFCGGFLTPREQPPYFATFPPVYYSGIVKRPYGISPYAAPAGIVPVELTVAQPLTVINPFFQNEVAPVSDELETEPSEVDENGNKVTWLINPHLEPVALRR